MKTLAVITLLLASSAIAQSPLTFKAALDRAIETRATTTSFDTQARMLEALPFRTLPSVRAETGFSSAKELNVITQNIGRFDAFTAIVAVDYPLVDGGAERRRVAALRTDAQLLRRRATDEAENVFDQTLDAFAQLYTTEQRLALLNEGTQRVTALRDRARAMLDSGQISNITAAQWQEQALATQSIAVDLELQRLEAETRLKQLLGDASGEPLHVVLTLGDDEPVLRSARIDDIVQSDAAVMRASLDERRKRLAVEEAAAQRKPQVLLSAFGGVAAIPSSYRGDADEGTFGIYGMRVTLSLPMFDPATARRVAEARLQAEDAARARSLTAAATRNRIDLLWLAIRAAERRIELLKEAVDVAKRREESVARLVTAGVRPEAELLEAANAVARRESDLLAVRVDRWKLVQRVRYAASHEVAPDAHPVASLDDPH